MQASDAHKIIDLLVKLDQLAEGEVGVQFPVAGAQEFCSVAIPAAAC
jgi:hypothetical protein